jgi:REP element-mobilizing transposase RayT
MKLCNQLQAVCRRQGLYLELVAAHADHVHLLLRLHQRGAEARLRGVLAHTCREFVGEVVPQPLRRGLQFVDWRQPLYAHELGAMRRRILRQEFVHRRQSLAEELVTLGLQAPNGACIVLGEVRGAGSP